MIQDTAINGPAAVRLLEALIDRNASLAISQGAFAEMVNYTESYWSYLRNGQRRITPDVCAHVLAVFPWPDPLATLAIEALRELGGAA